MKPAEIVAVAMEKHGRKIPVGTINGNLNRWKKEGRVINSIIGWSLAPPIPCNPQPERTDPVAWTANSCGGRHTECENRRSDIP